MTEIDKKPVTLRINTPQSTITDSASNTLSAHHPVFLTLRKLAYDEEPVAWVRDSKGSTLCPIAIAEFDRLMNVDRSFVEMFKEEVIRPSSFGVLPNLCQKKESPRK
jgi:hypothetical protein